MNDYFHLQFSAGEQAGQSLIQNAQNLYELQQRLEHTLNQLYASGLHGSFIDALEVRCRHILNTLGYLGNENGETGQDILTVVRMARELDAACASQFASYTGGDGVSLPGATAQNSFRLDVNAPIDGGWYGAPIGEAQAIVVNGIRTSTEGLKDLMDGASEEWGVPVTGVYNATYGTTTKGFVQDGIQTVADKFQALTGIRLGPENPAVSSLMAAIRAKDGDITVIGYSQGGAIASAALWELARNGYPLSNVKVITMGSASFNFPPGIESIEHRVHENDIVPMYIGGRKIYYHFNPVTLAKERITGEVKFYPSLNPLTAHGSNSYLKNFDSR